MCRNQLQKEEGGREGAGRATAPGIVAQFWAPATRNHMPTSLFGSDCSARVDAMWMMLLLLLLPPFGCGRPLPAAPCGPDSSGSSASVSRKGADRLTAHMNDAAGRAQVAQLQVGCGVAVVLCNDWDRPR